LILARMHTDMARMHIDKACIHIHIGIDKITTEMKNTHHEHFYTITSGTLTLKLLICTTNYLFSTLW